MYKKLLLIAALVGLVYWLVKDRLGGEPEEFTFTEAPAADGAVEVPPASEAPPAG
jgi:hypothetical protein